MKYRRLHILVAAVFVLLFSWSCEGYLDQFNRDKISTEMEFNPSFAGPIAYGGFSIQNILETLNDSSGLILQTEDSLIYIYYADTAFSLDASGLISIPDNIGSETYISNDINIPAWINIPTGTEYNFYKEEKLDFAISDDDRIDSIFLKSGVLNMTAFSEFKHTGLLTVTSSSVIDQFGDSLVLEIPVDKLDGTFTANDTYDLAGYKLTMEEEGGMAFIKINVNLKLLKSAEGLSVDEEAGIDLSFNDIEYRSVFGFIAGRDITDLEQSLEIGFFENLESIPSIFFADPQINIAVHNSIGVPLSLNINSFRSRSAVSGEFVDLTFYNDTMMPYTIYAPTIDQIGQSVTTYRNLNYETCNIRDMLSNIPDYIEFSFNASTGNPPGSTEQNFILDTSKMSLEVEVLVPFHLRTSGYTLVQPIDVDLQELMESIDFIESVKFTLSTVNEWPLGISLQIYFEDDQGTVVDSLFQGDQAFLAAAPVTATGELDRSRLVENPFEVELTKEKIDGLDGATNMSIKASAFTSNNGNDNVKFYSNYLLNYKLAIDAQFNINTSEL